MAAIAAVATLVWAGNLGDTWVNKLILAVDRGDTDKVTLAYTGTGDLDIDATGGNISFSSALLNDVLDPVAAQDASTKNYHDTNLRDPAGSDTQIQFNNSGAFGADADFTWDDSTDILSVNGGAVFNEDGDDFDFRVEGLTDTNLINVDAQFDRIAIGGSVFGGPEAFKVHKDTRFTGDWILEDTDTFTDLSIYAGLDAWVRQSCGRTVGGGRTCGVILLDNTTLSWQFAKNTTNDFRLYNYNTASNTWYANSNGNFEVNANDIDSDFQVHGDTVTHALFVQGSDSFVGIHDSTPDAPLDVAGDSILGNTTGDIATINDVLLLTPRATAPGSPAKGTMYFDSTNNDLCVYDGTAWDDLTTGTSPGNCA